MDKITTVARSSNMRRVKSCNTAPELIVRSILHRSGYRFRIHKQDLPGKPDIVLPKHRKIIFVHGCFWHGHSNCKNATRPMSNVEFWNTKLDKNIKRDFDQISALESNGWEVLVVWECQVKNPITLQKILYDFLKAESDRGKG